MQDTIIKGTGNSRTLRSVPNFLTMYPDHQSFGQALIRGEVPIDLGPLNNAGLDVHGTELNKASLLKDATAALFGLGTGAVPDDVLAQIAPKIAAAYNKSLVSIQALSGSYKETGEEMVIQIGFNPIFAVRAGYRSKSPVWWELDFYFDGRIAMIYRNSSNDYVSLNQGDWAIPSNALRFPAAGYSNVVGEKFHYVAFG